MSDAIRTACTNWTPLANFNYLADKDISPTSGGTSRSFSNIVMDE
jgi:hypothetical protein